MSQPVPASTDQPPPFCVHDAVSANWVVRKIVEARRYAERVEQWAAAELRRAQRKEQFFLLHYGQQLEAWARKELAQQTGRRSVNLPAGRVGFRIHPPHLTVKDEPALLRWCKANLPAAVAVVERILKSAVREHVQKTGELPDGADVSGHGERFFIK